MCRDCLVEPRPDRGSTCLESGAYVLNFAQCGGCGTREFAVAPGVANRRSEEESGSDEDSEEIEYQHACPQCEHVVAQHFYRFEVNGPLQEYTMDCALCGHGGATSRWDLSSASPTPAGAAEPAEESKTAEAPAALSADMFSAIVPPPPSGAAAAGDESGGDDAEWDDDD